jgi:hypothetical protein
LAVAVVFLLTETKAIKAEALVVAVLVREMLLVEQLLLVKVMLAVQQFTLHLTMVAVVVAVLEQ